MNLNSIALGCQWVIINRSNNDAAYLCSVIEIVDNTLEHLVSVSSLW